MFLLNKNLLTNLVKMDCFESVSGKTLYCNKVYSSLAKTGEQGTLCPPSDVYVRNFLCPSLYFNKTLLHKSS